ncbi:MAG: UvrB/UvrC motif-containing protein, partial [Deltaproteobacteria bacterium]|nr:UvrB/UvrC motif-containing protein [Deltaproteobacteria bacterium]
RMAEDLTEYYAELGVRVKYLHADINTLDRMNIIRELRKGEFDVLIGINLLREGLDIPEVSLVAILDADKEGYLRSSRSLIQTFGRAARNVRGKVIMYADVVTASMQQAIDETERRRKIQQEYNEKNSIIPETIRKEIMPIFEDFYEPEVTLADTISETVADYESLELDTLDDIIGKLETEMRAAAKALEFEKAAELRDQIVTLKKMAVFEI